MTELKPEQKERPRSPLTGQPVPNGRPKGCQNKLTRLAKDNIAKVFDQIGGTDKMAEWALKNQTEFYRIYARLIPVALVGDSAEPPIALDISEQVKEAILKEIPHDRLVEIAAKLTGSDRAGHPVGNHAAEVH
jgi:hypothetical protein